ncbi:hypothetical protein ACVJGD_002766 [Bradyrhizobium sp. USDA 10063]
MMNPLAYCNGNHDLPAIAERIAAGALDCAAIAAKLSGAGLLAEVDSGNAAGLIAARAQC